MHLLTFIQMRQPGPVFRAAVLVAQGVVYNAFFISYLLSPKTCHRFVGYLEEEAVKTYTHAIADLDAGKLPLWTVRSACGGGGGWAGECKGCFAGLTRATAALSCRT